MWPRPRRTASCGRCCVSNSARNRKQTKAHWDVHIANSFIGNMLRFELLSRFGNQQQILDESTAYLLYMAERTGTLWENDGAYASCNHGFASHIVHTLYRDVLGVARVDMPTEDSQPAIGRCPTRLVPRQSAHARRTRATALGKTRATNGCTACRCPTDTEVESRTPAAASWLAWHRYAD